MVSAPFHVPYPRPKSLSDPFHDNNSSTSSTLEQLLNTLDESLYSSDFRILLGPYLPAGTYEETCYFLPLAFRYVLAHDDDALGLITSLVWYCSEYVWRLRADKIVNDARSAIRGCFEHWTNHFNVIHFDSDACKAKGWELQHFDYVPNGEVIGQGLEDLVRFAWHLDLVVAFIRGLSQSSDPVKQAWFLELLRCKICAEAYCPPDHPKIVPLFEDKVRIRALVTLVKETVVPIEKSPTYWPDSLALVETYCKST
jgi:hypothetical protein